MNIENSHFVSVQGDNVIFTIPPRILSKEDALVFAAWVVALADIENKFPSILKRVQEGE